MNTKKGVWRSRAAIISLAAHIAAFSINSYGWSISGTVKTIDGVALSGVSVTVKDSADYSDITDDNGNFSLGSPTSSKNIIKENKPSLYSAKFEKGELLINSPWDGALKLSLFDCAGRVLWTDKVVSTKGIAKAAFPSKLSRGIVFLQISHSDNEQYFSMGWGPHGLYMKPSHGISNIANTKKAQATTFPTLLFKKTDYRDTSFTMTSDDMTDVEIVMQQEKICPLPTSIRWQSSGILVDIKPNASHKIVSVKDPTIQKYKGKYLIYCTVYNTTTNTFNMQFIQFADFSEAISATPFFMDQVPGFSGYKCAPELFYFAPQDLWYLIWQQQDPAYSTTKTPDDPTSWSAPKRFYTNGQIPNAPQLPIDYWPIADDKNFYLFFTGDDGKVYRVKTTLEQFPNGFGAPVVVKSLATSIIFEGSSHYKVKGTANTYLHVVEGMGSTGRYFSAWTSEGIEGDWKDYMVGQSNPFARTNNVTYPQGVTDWTDDVSHGELIRENPDQTQELDMCNLRLLYQGKAPNAGGDYNLLPYKLGLLTAISQ